MSFIIKIFSRIKFAFEASIQNYSFFLFIANTFPNIELFSWAKNLFLYLAGVKFKIYDLYFKAPLRIDNPNNLNFGRSVFINHNVYFEGQGLIHIGSNCQIGPNVVFATTDHLPHSHNTVIGNIIIHDNVWIGSNCVVCRNVILGPNVIVAAGAVVTKSFQNSLIGGAPAKSLKELQSIDI